MINSALHLHAAFTLFLIAFYKIRNKQQGGISLMVVGLILIAVSSSLIHLLEETYLIGPIVLYATGIFVLVSDHIMEKRKNEYQRNAETH